MKILCITPHRKRDYLAECIIEGLRDNGCELYCTDFGNLVDKVYSDDEILKLGDSFDYVFAIWGKCHFNNVPSPKFYLIDQLNCWNKVVYIDGSEYNYTGFNDKTDETLHPIFLKRAKWYFKRECTDEHLKQNIYPLPFASYKHSFKYDYFNDNKSIDILCSWGSNTSTGLREKCTEVCYRLKGEGYNIVTKYQPEYYKSINNSWIVLDAYGGGECNVRTFEILPNFSLPCIQKWTINMPYKFTHGDNILEYTNENELYDILKMYLSNKFKIKEMTVKGNEHNKLYHTTKARVKYIFDTVTR